MVSDARCPSTGEALKLLYDNSSETGTQSRVRALNFSRIPIGLAGASLFVNSPNIASLPDLNELQILVGATGFILWNFFHYYRHNSKLGANVLRVYTCSTQKRSIYFVRMDWRLNEKMHCVNGMELEPVKLWDRMELQHPITKARFYLPAPIITKLVEAQKLHPRVLRTVIDSQGHI